MRELRNGRYDVRYGACHLAALTPDTRIEAPSAAFGALLPGAEGQRYDALIHPDDRDAFWAQIVPRAERDGMAAVEHRLAEGQERYALTLARRTGDGYAVLLADAASVAAIREDARPFLEAMPCGVASYRWALDAQGAPLYAGLMYASARLLSLLGTDEDHFLREAGGDLMAFLDPQDADRALQAQREAVRRPDEPVRAHIAALRPDGTRVHLLATCVGVEEAPGFRELLCVFQDVTPLYAAQEALGAQAERIRHIVAATGEKFIEYDVAEDRLVLMAWEGGEDQVLEGALAGGRMADLVHGDDLAALESALRDAIRAPAFGSLDLRTVAAGPGLPWCRVYYTSVVDARERVVRVVGRLANIDAEKRDELALRTKAERDALTSLYSRGAAEMLIERFFAQEAQAHSQGRHALLMIDLDNFKEINDYFGHSYGDVVLTEIADIIRASFRTTDIVGRLGGDEFIVLMRGYRSQEAIEQVCTRICAAICAKYQAALSGIGLSATIGVACYPEHGTSLRALYEKADMANYTAKSQGKNCWHIYAEEASLRYRSDREASSGALESLQQAVEQALLDTLHRADDRRAAIRAALAVIARRFGAHRAYIVLLDDGDIRRDESLLWCEDGYEVDIARLDAVSRADRAAFLTDFDERGLRVVGDMRALPEPMRALYQAAGTRSLLHYAIMRDGVVWGFFGVEDCLHEGRRPMRLLIDALDGVLRTLLLFVRQELSTRETIELVGATGLLDGLEHTTYIVNARTHTLLFVNRRAMALLPRVNVGEQCYQSLYGLDAPCEGCPLGKLPDAGEAVSAELHFAARGLWGRVFASWLDVGTTKEYCLVQCVDVTAYIHARAGQEEES